MPIDGRRPNLGLPRYWKPKIRSAALHVISLAQFAIAHARGWAANSVNARVRLKAENCRLRQEVALLREEIRIKDARIVQLAPQRRPHYPPGERMAILELKAARGWSLAQTASTFLVTAVTIAEWLRRIDEEGPNALVRMREPVNKFPDFVRYTVQRLRALCPTMGKVKIAQNLARAGLHLGATTVGRMLHDPPSPLTGEGRGEGDAAQEAPPRVVRAKYPNHVWHVDLTTVPLVSGFWTAWWPFALPQRWPFCWWTAVVVDHFSRRVMGTASFHTQPDATAVTTFLGRAIRMAGDAPKHVICDRGTQFDCQRFRQWCRRRGIRPRYGAVGKHGSIAIVERLILTMKQNLKWLLTPPMRRDEFRRELSLIVDWYNGNRPHTSLRGRTPNEVYFGRFPACRMPRYEPRSQWPRGSPCAKPWALVRGKRGARLELAVAFHGGRKHLPIVQLRHVA